MLSKLQTASRNWDVQEGTAKEVAPQLKDKESEVLAIVAEREDPLVHLKFEVLKNLIYLVDEVVRDRTQRKWREVIEALTPDVPLSKNKLVEAVMLVEARKAVLESKDFVRAQEIAKAANFSRKNPSSQPNRWKRAGQIFAVSYKGSDLYPSYALDWKQGARPLPVVSKILKLFADKDDWQKAFWFGSVNSYLRNKMPKDLLKSHPEDVLKAAELEAIGVQHG